MHRTDPNTEKRRRAKGASIRPSTFAPGRNWSRELKAYAPEGARGKPYGHSFGMRHFPADLAGWLEAIADAHERKVGEVEAFCIGEGARLLLSRRAVDRYRDARRAVGPRGPEHAAWFNSFRFPIEAVQWQREDFHVTKTEWGFVQTLVKILRLPIPQLIPLCIMAVAMGLPPVHQEAGREMLKTIRRFVAALNERATEGERRAAALLTQPAPKLSRASFDDV